jgi:hypothetical protein
MTQYDLIIFIFLLQYCIHSLIICTFSPRCFLLLDY